MDEDPIDALMPGLKSGVTPSGIFEELSRDALAEIPELRLAARAEILDYALEKLELSIEKLEVGVISQVVERKRVWGITARHPTLLPSATGAGNRTKLEKIAVLAQR